MSGARVPAPPDEDLVADIVALAADPVALEAFEEAGRSCRWCAEPVRLSGRSVTVDQRSGEVLESFSTVELHGRELYKACGTRRATRCPSCAADYKGDARALVVAGLVGGKGVPGSVADHPMVFATLTAPSFGAVHRRPGPGGPCQASGPGRCRHGRTLFCLQQHREDDPLLGEALCPECYDFASAVLFNASVSELWRRTVIYTRRHLARLVGVPAKELSGAARLSYVKVGELQRRGAVHLHVIVRLDAAEGGELPAGLDARLLALALRLGASQVRVPLPGGRGPATWGEQLDCRVVTQDVAEGTARVANYLAKYSTKGSDGSGALDRRLRGPRGPGAAGAPAPAPPPRRSRLARRRGRGALAPAAPLLGPHPGAGLRSHFLTKSRGAFPRPSKRSGPPARRTRGPSTCDERASRRPTAPARSSSSANGPSLAAGGRGALRRS